MALIDPVTGRPFDRNAIGRPLTVRPLPARKTTGTLDPVRIGRALKDADQGRISQLIEMAVAIEDADWQWRTVIQKRKLAVIGLPLRIEAAGDDARSQADAELIRMLVVRSGFRRLIYDLLDGIAKGFGAAEIDWRKEGALFLPARYVRRDPRYFVFAKDDPDRLLWAGAGGGSPVEPDVWSLIVHRPMLTSEPAARSGLARQGLWLWMYKSFGLREWAEFLEAYGQPIRIGKWHAGADETQKAVLRQAVMDLGALSGVIIPQGMEIGFEHVGSRSDPKLHLTLLQYLDQAASKLVLGETTTTDAISGGHAVAQEHNEVRGDIRDADAEDIAETLARDLIRPVIDINRGPPPGGLYPRLVLAAAKATDLAAMTGLLKELVPLGLRVEQSVVRDRAGLPDPGPDARWQDLLMPPPRPEETIPAADGPAAHTARHGREAMARSPRAGETKARSPRAGQTMARIDRMIGRLDREAGDVTEGWLDEIRFWLAQAEADGLTLSQTRDRLLDLYPMLDADDLGSLLAEAMLAADLLGRQDAQT